LNRENNESKIKEKKSLGIALSGGGSRAIAFHLGCFRALNDLGFLDKIDHMSSVSGGSVFSGLYNFYEESFESFDDRVVEVLRKGLQNKVAKKYFFPTSIIKSLGTTLISGVAARGSLIVGKTPPFTRWYSRTNAFIDVLERDLFHGLTLQSEVKNNIDVVINSCDLATGTAFRFGTKETGNWKLGRVNTNDIPVSEAVVCSAAYPFFLPALDKYYEFEKAGKVFNERVYLTDGGVYDNSGVTCFDPNNDPKYSFNSFKPNFIFAFDAGHGIYGKKKHPYYMYSRLMESYSTTFKKRIDGIKKDLHQYLDHGRIQGFIYSYLGQNDMVLPSIPSDFITSDKVSSYPTDFKAMKEKNIELLAGRGEQLTRILISHYNPII
tara:strand:- start:65 stop:1201 length:1137 start_codon:yes stop_codon:yes gene_type:complete